MAMKKWLGFADYQQALAGTLQELPPVVVLEGEEDFLRLGAVEAIAARLGELHPGIAQLSFFGPAVQGEPALDLHLVLEELQTSSLFSARKAVFFRRAQRTLFQGGEGSSSGKKGGPLEALAEYLKNPSPDNFLLIELEKNNRQRMIGKALAECATVPCPPLNKQQEVAAWLRARAGQEGRELDRDAADMLFSAHGGNLGALAGEIEKLALYAGEKKRIGLTEVQAFLTGSREFSAFELTNAVERKELQKALYYARLITGQGSRDQSGKRMDGEASAHQALAMLAGKLEGILRARAVVAAKGGTAEVAAALGLGPWQAEGLYAAAKRYSLQELQRGLRTLADEMRMAHDTGADAQLSLERAVIAACGG